MENLPVFISLFFGATTLLAAWFLFRAAHYSRTVGILIILYGIMQTVVALSGFYTITHTLPPRLLFMLLPPVVLIIILFNTRTGRSFIDSLHKPTLTLLHLVRLPIELVLFWLFLHGMVPELMTFEGRNFDILVGLTALPVYYLGFVKKTLPNWVMLGWNFIGLGLLLNIVFYGILSVATPFQQFGFDQPNVALTYFPFVFLPGFLVPLVFFSHLATIRYLLAQKRSSAQILPFQNPEIV